MMFRMYLRWPTVLTGFGIAALLQGCGGGGTTAVTKPNIIVILVDDMGFSDIGCYGSEINTPNIDRLGYEGLRFTQFYNASRCCPSRASLLTGLYPHEAGMGDMVDTRGHARDPGPYQGWLADNTVTIAEALREHGYATYMSGKWHVGEDSVDWPLQRGFDRYFGLVSGANSYFEILPRRIVVSQNHRLGTLPENFYMTEALTDSALFFLQQNQPEERPFFLYLAYTAPHWPLHARNEKIAKYRGRYLGGWDSLRQERHEKQMSMGLFQHPVDLSPRDEVIPEWKEVDDKDKDAWDLKMAVYAAMVEAVDDGVGKIVHYLTETKQLDNTVIFFLSDNGACHETLGGRMDRDLESDAAVARTLDAGVKGSYTAYGREWANAGNTPFRMYKHWTHEGGISTPFIAHYPKIIKGGDVVADLAQLIDIMPTVLELGGATYPARRGSHDVPPARGTSLVPLMKGEHWKGHDYLYWEHEGSRAVRTPKWKLVSLPNASWELYDMDSDRSELHDLSRVYPDTVAALRAHYDTWASSVGVKQP